MKNLNLLDSGRKPPRQKMKDFKNSGIPTHSESLKRKPLAYFTDKIGNPLMYSTLVLKKILIKFYQTLEKYDGMIWGGSSLNIYNNDCIEIKQTNFFYERMSLRKLIKYLAICWGMQVAVTAAGGQVKKSS